MLQHLVLASSKEGFSIKWRQVFQTCLNRGKKINLKNLLLIEIATKLKISQKTVTPKNNKQ
jgi:hypothetical protein